MKISIIIPAYNSEKTLFRCLQSIYLQDAQEVIKEVIVINDGSKDNTAGVVLEFKKKYAKIRLIEKENGGVSSARNAGLKVATGKYVLFCDSDDELTEDCCGVLYNAMEASTCDMVICGYEMVGENTLIKRCPVESKYFEVNHIKECFDYFFNGFFLNTPWGRIFHKEKISIFYDENLQNGEDIKFNLDYLRENPYCIAIPQKLYIVHTENENSLSRGRQYALAATTQTQINIGQFIFDMDVKVNWSEFSDRCLSLIWTNIIDGRNLEQFKCKTGYEMVEWTSSYQYFLEKLKPKKLVNIITKSVIKYKLVAVVFFELLAFVKRKI